MEFKSISIKNFRNFEEVIVDLSNKNIFFGMNDVGKTNFLYAFSDIHNLREINGLVENKITDYVCKNINGYDVE